MLFLDYTPELTTIEYQVYQYVANHLNQTIYMRIRELAVATHTSTATIQRFCDKFECAGFSEFKVRLKLLNKEQKQQNVPVLLDISSHIDFLNRASQPYFQEQIKRAITILKDKELIIFLGVGSSNILAEYGALYFSSLYQMAVRIEDPVTDPIRYLSKEIISRSCVIALSVSGETKEITKYLSNINFHDVDIISITNSADSTISKLSNVNIPYYIPKENMAEQDITSQLPTLFIIEYMAKVIHTMNQNNNFNVER